MTDILNVQGTEIRTLQRDGEQFINITDIAKHFGDVQLITDWLKNKNTLEFINVWESLNNAEFNSTGFKELLSQAGVNRFRVAIKDLKQLNAKGIYAAAGRYGGTYAHKDIAIEFCTWLSPEFKLYLITEIQRLKKQENSEISFERNVRRIMVKASYRVHTDAIKDVLIPPTLDSHYTRFIYADEADVLNVAVFGMTAKQWRTKYPDRKGNIRDDQNLCTIVHLIILNNLESQNALLIRNKVPREERVRILHEEAVRQMKSLTESQSVKALEPSKLLLNKEH